MECSYVLIFNIIIPTEQEVCRLKVNHNATINQSANQITNQKEQAFIFYKYREVN